MSLFLPTQTLWPDNFSVVAMTAVGAQSQRSDEPTSSVILIAEQGPLAGHRIVLRHSPITIGRGSENDLVLPETAVSRHHAQISWQGSRWLLEDLGSTNGVFLNRQRLTDSPPLHDGDLISIGDSVFLFQVEAALAEHPLSSGSSQRAKPLHIAILAVVVVMLALLAVSTLLLINQSSDSDEPSPQPGLPILEWTNIPPLSTVIPGLEDLATHLPALPTLPSDLTLPGLD